MALTAKQKRFVDEYLIDLNATQAAIRAGYKKSEYTDTNAKKILDNTSVKAEIDKALAERSKRTGINAERVLQELARIGFANISDIVDLTTGEVKENATKEDLSCIQSIKVRPTEFGTEREVKMYDKKSALVDLGKHLGLFRDRVEVSGIEGVTIINDIPKSD